MWYKNSDSAYKSPSSTDTVLEDGFDDNVVRPLSDPQGWELKDTSSARIKELGATALVVAFSLGLAAVLTVVGLLFVKSSLIVRRVPRLTAWGRFLPVASALVITVLGVVITVGAGMSLGL